MVNTASPQNGAFESGDLTPWKIWQGTAYIGWAAHTGQHGLTMGPSAIVNQIITGLVPGGKYRLSAWVLASQQGTNTVELAMYGANGWEQSQSSAMMSAWQPITQSATASSSGTLVLDLVTLSASEAVYWDDIALVATN